MRTIKIDTAQKSVIRDMRAEARQKVIKEQFGHSDLETA